MQAMNKSNAIIWFEWFNYESQKVFEHDTKNLWGLGLRNGIAPTIFRKWLREEICKSARDNGFAEEEIQLIENQWANQKNISSEKFAKNRSLILEKLRVSEDNFKLYCVNELKAIRWAEEKWTHAAEQIYLETKDKYDEVKLQITTIPSMEKGLTLEIYQQLKEGEVGYSDTLKLSSAIRCQSEPEGSWYKKTELTREISGRLGKLRCGDLSAPFKVKNEYVIIKLLETRGTELTEIIRKKIIVDQLNSFIDYGVEKLLDYATSSDQGKQK